MNVRNCFLTRFLSLHRCSSIDTQKYLVRVEADFAHWNFLETTCVISVKKMKTKLLNGIKSDADDSFNPHNKRVLFIKDPNIRQF